VRFFPRTARRRLGVAVALCSLAVGATAVPLAHASLTAGDKLKDRQRKVQKRIEKAHDHLEHTSRRLIRAARTLEASRADLSDARLTLHKTRDKLAAARELDVAMQGQLAQAEIDLDAARLALTAGTAAVGRQRDSVAAMVSDIYMEGDPQLLAFASLLDAESPADLIRSAEGRNVIVGQETRAYDDLSAAEVLLEVREGAVEAAKDAVAAKAAEAAAHVVVMQNLETQAQAAKDDVVRLVAAHKDAKAEARKAKQRDRKKLRKLRKEDKRIERRLAELARRARLRALRNGQSTAPGDSGGFLARPVPGPVTSPFGMRVHPIFGYTALHDGTDFGGGCGTPMYAAADGRVVAEYYSSSYGHRLMIDHGFQRGVGLATIYNHATGYPLNVGDHVARGQVVGYVGSTGWSTGCHLHFTVMANGNPVDPSNWL
jgi:murein DD-endopeptidase MepM/ murein hydrolase activator NlpD